MSDILILSLVGIAAGILGGILGIGGGTIMVPVMVALGLPGVEAVGTSTLAILVISLVGSLQNWRMGFLKLKNLLLLGLPAVLTAFVGTRLATAFPEYVLLAVFGLFLLLNIYLVNLKKQIVARAKQREVLAQQGLGQDTPPAKEIDPVLARTGIGGVAGFLAGLFGVGGGVVMVPLQILLLHEDIKTAIQTSLGAIVITGLSAFTWHSLAGNVQTLTGVILGLGGVVGVQLGTRALPRLPDRIVTFLFCLLLALLSVYFFYKAWGSYLGTAP
ncbi:sulfite exporter TauE/SafE family protein [Leptolyngbya sp. KIOST-1]|uniref:sulfite exporter TauE/SafE family protein n=1 Tax=Leptolyngbya sp. KIOST-1 TaxID=1229172 RepID=UPI00056ADF52|nr:sulfite exporter TauE/SafE family protein [Leptolyngbya sp. KIOST-1]